MALIKINNQSLTNVTALPAGVGGDGGFKFIKKVTLSSSNGYFSATGLFSADYNHYKLIWEISNSVTNVCNNFRWIKASDGSIDTTASIDYVVIGRDNDAAVREKMANNQTHWVIEDDDLESGHKHYQEMNVYDPFNTVRANVSGTGNYTINVDDDVTTFHYAAGTNQTTSYQGIHIYVSDTVGGNINSSNTITGRLLVYGMAEA